MADNDPDFESFPAVRELSRPQRRVLGVLLEKGFTTPEQYPLTVKACTTGCNQKNNRDPLSNYSEDQVRDVLDELQQMGLIAVVHTESGRTERYRHYMRKRFDFTEPQLAILTELFLRGRQSLGELRGRASRMVPIESLDDLRRELSELIKANAVQSDMPLDRRGAEVDHAFYPPGEKRRMSPEHISTQSEAEVFDTHIVPVGMPAPVGDSAGAVRDEVESLRTELQSVRAELAELRDQMSEMDRTVRDLKQQLGG
ncbi:MAG: DUF480 domain-containing protein [Planctomycetaceae bacterium]|nr:DUF480 domain-containing protein [Planctomycetaceae bacterium]